MSLLQLWDPFTELDSVHRSFFSNAPNRRLASSVTPVDVYEDEKSVVLSAELPGVKAKDVHVEVHEGVLTLRAERKMEQEDKRDGYHRVERSYGKIERSFRMPETVDPEKVDADLSDGVLKVTLTKREAPQPKRISVKSKN